MPDIIHLTSLCNRSTVPVLEENQLVYILTEISPDPMLADRRMGLNIALVLDRSGSMDGHKLRSLKRAVNRIIDKLAPDDIISLITFETRWQLLAEAQPAHDKTMLKYLVDHIVAGGSTVMAPAIGEAIRQVKAHDSADRVSRIILLTDGEATDKEDHSRREADQAGALGFPIIGLGFGMDWNEEFLFELADRSLSLPLGTHGGTVEFIPTPTMALSIFQQVFESLHVVAQNVFIRMHLAQGIEARRVWQIKPFIRDISHSAIQASAVIVHFSDVEQDGVVFLSEVILPPRPESVVRISVTESAYDLPGMGPGHQASDLVLQYTKDPQRLDQYDLRVINMVERIQAYKLQHQALIEAEAGEVEYATRKLRAAVTILLNQGEHELAEQILREADHLEMNGHISNKGKKTIKLTSRKTTTLSYPHENS